MDNHDTPREVTGPGPHRRRWLRLGGARSQQARRRILDGLYPPADEPRRWWFRFGVMMALSVVVAALGLSTDSAAVVIGAMLIAPLMTPVLGVSAAVAMGSPRRVVGSAGAVIVGSAGAVVLSFALMSLLPAGNRALTTELLSRTSPDLRDLVVAFAAGAAGAYATVRQDLSAALPGVAVAVALVPPLAATGYCLASGRADLASGALLLYAANLFAIVLVGALVFLAAGLLPERRHQSATRGTWTGLFVAGLATAAVAMPLTVTSLASVTHAQTTETIDGSVVRWLEPYPSLRASAVVVQGTLVTVDVVGPTSPPPSQSLATALAGVIGKNAAVRVRWFRSGSAAASAPITLPGAPTITAASARGPDVLLSWTAASDGGSALTSYVVRAVPDGSGSAASVTLPPTELHASLGGLTAGTRYELTVTAENDLGTGTPSSARAVTTTVGALSYELAAVDGSVYPSRTAPYLGGPYNLRLAAPVVGIAATPDGRGYWLVAADSGVFAYGDARFFGSSAGRAALAAPVVGIAATPDGRGYWLVAADGGVFAYGDAGFYGSAGTTALSAPVVGMFITARGDGYWLVTRAGGLLAFGAAAAAGAISPPPVGATISGAGHLAPAVLLTSARPARTTPAISGRVHIGRHWGGRAGSGDRLTAQG